MKRMHVLVGQRRLMLLATLAILVIAAAAFAASSASFTASSANPGNVFTSGALSIGNHDGSSNDREGKAIVGLTASAMKPGDSVQGTAVISNTGTIAGDFTLNKTISADTLGTKGGDLANKLDLTVTENGTTVWSGKLGSATGMPQSLGTWDPDQAHTYVFTVSFPDNEAASGADNDFMGASVTANFTWSAVQH